MYLVTGISGNVGSQVVAQLLECGAEVRALVRDPGKATPWQGRIEVVTGDLEKPESLAVAAGGVKGIFVMNVGGNEAFRRLLNVIKAQGQPRLVFLSTILAGVPGMRIGEIHKEKEDAIREYGFDGCFVRAGGLMSNTYQWVGSIREQGAVFNPMGTGGFAAVAPEDIAAVAVHALLTPGLKEQVLEVTGGKPIAVPEQVDILAGILGRPIRCVDIPVEVAVQGMIKAGVPAPIATAVGQSFEAIRAGRGAQVKDTVVRLTGREPKTFEAWATEHEARFR